MLQRVLQQCVLQYMLLPERLQIARIAASTVCAPQGLYSAGEEPGVLEKSEDFAGALGR